MRWMVVSSEIDKPRQTNPDRNSEREARVFNGDDWLSGIQPCALAWGARGPFPDPFPILNAVVSGLPVFPCAYFISSRSLEALAIVHWPLCDHLHTRRLFPEPSVLNRHETARRATVQLVPRGDQCSSVSLLNLLLQRGGTQPKARDCNCASYNTDDLPQGHASSPPPSQLGTFGKAGICHSANHSTNSIMSVTVA